MGVYMFELEKAQVGRQYTICDYDTTTWEPIGTPVVTGVVPEIEPPYTSVNVVKALPSGGNYALAYVADTNEQVEIPTEGHS